MPVNFPAAAPALSEARRALAVYAHPADVDVGCAGTIAGRVEEGAEDTYLRVTRGDPGGSGPTSY
ncbi:hypothetical protein NCC78_13125 [Micromonospora phytophila]|uniref:hypothetical protein n=1 Tax=Micromonospora phytophila TaxID=709888 RepID=UPI002030FC29|nr:hypothetical protein [Micromonospora phytophila]MCM0675626.1 hypothetical protein [Micromonospora phytophila]